MSLSKYAGSGDGTHFITAKELNALKKKEIKGAITGTPFESNFTKTEDDGSEKDEVVLRIPMDVEGIGEGSWGPGKNAIQLLVETIGSEWASWTFPVEGHFEKREWSNSRGQSGLAWNFVPKVQTLNTPSSTPTKGTTGKQAAAKVLSCGMCSSTFNTIAGLVDHTKGAHGV